MPKIALIDMDGTIADYDGAMKKSMALLSSPNEPKEYIPHSIDMPYIRARENMIRNQPGWWVNLEPIKSGFDVVELFKKYNFQLNVLTKAPSKLFSAWAGKAEWCRKYIPEADIIMTPNKGLVYGKVLFDDWVPYIEAWIKYRPRGIVIMPNQLWNKDYIHPQVIRYENNLDEVEMKLKQIE